MLAGDCNIIKLINSILGAFTMFTKALSIHVFLEQHSKTFSNFSATKQRCWHIQWSKKFSQWCHPYILIVITTECYSRCNVTQCWFYVSCKLCRALNKGLILKFQYAWYLIHYKINNIERRLFLLGSDWVLKDGMRKKYLSQERELCTLTSAPCFFITDDVW